MAPITNSRVTFNEIPADYPIPGRTVVYDTTPTIDLETVPLHGGVLLKTLVLSIDPYMRRRMRDPAIRGYHPAYEIGQPLENFGVCLVVRSEHPVFSAGNLSPPAFEEYSIQTEVNRLSKIENKYNLPWSMFAGAVGMPGQTAYYGWKEHVHAKKGEVAFVSAGASAVGSLVIQLAKRDGLKVIASAGSDDKVAFMKELGADVAFNYKTTNMSEVLDKEGPINVYWDNVGGETLDAALLAATKNACFVECGMISEYNSNTYGMKNLMRIINQEIKLCGFVVTSLAAKHKDAFFTEVPGLVASGQLRFREDLSKGLESIGEAILTVQKGVNTGKSIVVVADQ